MKMLGLFLYDYDYYEFEKLIDVSFNIDLLVREWSEVCKIRVNDILDPYPLVYDEENHLKLKDDDKQHYYIKELRIL